MGALSSNTLRFSWAGAALLVMALGCGGSTDSPGSGGSGGAGATGGAGTSGGTGGSGGSSTGGTAGSGGSAGGVPDGGEVVCGGMVCPPSTFGVMACCTMQNTCGINVGFGGQTMCTDRPTFDGGFPRPDAGGGVPDPNCASLMVGNFTLAGCCMPDNTCGFSSQIAGCISLDTLRSLNLPGVNLPEGGPMSCVYPPP